MYTVIYCEWCIFAYGGEYISGIYQWISCCSVADINVTYTNVCNDDDENNNNTNTNNKKQQQQQRITAPPAGGPFSLMK